MVPLSIGFSGQYNTTSTAAYNDFKSFLSSDGFEGPMWFVDALPPGAPNEWIFTVEAIDYRLYRFYSLTLTDPTASGHSIKPASFATDFPNAISMNYGFSVQFLG